MKALARCLAAGDLMQHVRQSLPTLNQREAEILWEEAYVCAERHGLLGSCGNFFAEFLREKRERKANVDRFFDMLKSTGTIES